MDEIAKCSIVGSSLTLLVTEVVCTVELHVSMAFVSLRIKYLNSTGSACDTVFECGMSRGRATATACDVVLTDIKGTVTKAYSTAVVDPSSVRHTPNPEMQQAMGLEKSSRSRPTYDPDVFRMPILGIGADFSCEVHMQYIQPLRFWDGSYSIDVPLYIPEYQMSSNRIGEIVTINCTINTCTPESSWGSTSHRMNILLDTPTRYLLTSEPSEMINANFNISYKAWSSEILGSCLLEEHKKKKSGSFLLFLSPPETVMNGPSTAKTAQSFSRNIVFLLDRSGSMTGTPMAVARHALSRALEQLTPDDGFAICAFDHEMWWLGLDGSDPIFKIYAISNADTYPAIYPATTRNIGMAQQALEGIEARGGTDILTPVKVTLALMKGESQEAKDEFVPRSEQGKALSTPILFLITDGAVRNERVICSYMRDKGAGVRAFTLAIGPYANRYFLKMLAMMGCGYSDVCLYMEELGELIEGLMKKTYCPVLRDVTLVVTDVKKLDVYPNPPPDLFVGAPVCISGTFQGKFPDFVTVKGMDPTGTIRELQISVVPADAVPVQKVFAQQQIEYLTAMYWLNTERRDRDKAIKVAVANSVPCTFTETIAYEVREPSAVTTSANKNSQQDTTMLAENRRQWRSGLALGGVLVLGTALTLDLAFGSVTATAANALLEGISNIGIGGMFDGANFDIGGSGCCCFDFGNIFNCGDCGCGACNIDCNVCDACGGCDCGDCAGVVCGAGGQVVGLLCECVGAMCSGGC